MDVLKPPALLQIVGLALLELGLFVWFWPAAVAATGVLFLTYGWLIDDDDQSDLEEEMKWDSET